MEVRNGDDSGPSGAAGGVRERDGGSLSSSAPSTFNGFQQFQQQQQQQEEQNQQQQQTNRPGGSGTGSLHNGGDEQSAGGEQTPGDRAETGMAPQRELDPLTARLSAFRAKDIGCDVAFVVGDEKEKLKAHKLVLGASSPVFFAMFYGPLAASSPQPPFRPTFGNQQNANNPPEHAPPAAVSNNASRAASRQSARGGEIGGQAQNGGDEEEYDEEEYEEEEAEEYEEGEADNLSNGSSSLTSSMEGASAAEQQRQQAGNEDPASSSQFHHRRPSLKAAHRNLTGANHQQQEDDEQLLKAELAASGLQMVRVPDCESKAFAILLDFVYSDFDVHNLSNCCLLTEENVMNTLYAAKKYDIHALVAECVRYCTARLTATNAVSLLAQARMLDENTLVQQCYQVIDQNTDVALQAANVADIDRNTLIDVLARNQLDPRSELVIFYAAKAWGEAECARRGIPATIENLRQCLGPAMQLIRFSLMDVNEFGQAASSSLLSCEEIAEVFLHLTVRPRPACRFAAQGFRANSRSKHIVQRFLSVSAKPRSRREHKVCFTADRNVLVSGLSVYGVFQANNKVYNDYPKSNWEHDVEIKLETSTDSPSIYGSALKLLASNTVQLSGKFGDPTPVMAYFTEPVPCQENVTYLATVHFKNETGVSTFQGKDGQDLVSVELPFDQTITFKFHSYRYGFDGGDGGRAEGQIPAIHFLIQWPTEAK